MSQNQHQQPPQGNYYNQGMPMQQMQYGMQPGMQPGMQQGMMPNMQNMTPQQQQLMMMQMQQMQQQQMQGQQQETWMAKPEGVSDCPPGLEYLTMIDQLLIKQKIELFEAFSGYEMNNKYVIRNTLGQQVYFAKEDTDFCVRNFCGPQRPFTIHVEDNMGQEVIQLIRPYKCMCYGQCFSCSECCQDEVEVQAPVGTIVGYVKQVYEGCEINYIIQDPNRETTLRIQGPSYCHCYCPGDDIPFSLLSKDKSVEVGRVSKQWGNLFKEWFTDADNFGIQFPIDLDVRMKATVLGAVFLIDFMFFERQGRRHN